MLIDESLPKPLRRDLTGFESFTVQQRGWSKTKNGALLKLAESAGFDAFLTADQSPQFQQKPDEFEAAYYRFPSPVKSHRTHPPADAASDCRIT
ncbi:MAG TPA: hypothetical protein VGQ65_14010 [Thermoanaerobaculia bacterium]|nr:hypothetical protein [Thermoanaerobaculia bacterium]